MDNEAHLNQLTELFEKQKELSKSAGKRKGQRPCNRASRAELKRQFPVQIANGIPPGFSGMVRQTVIGNAYTPCLLPLADLKPMAIHELELETVHRGRVLIVRAIGHPKRLQSVQNAVKDRHGDAERLSIYNFDIELRPEEVLAKCQIVAIKEPYYKVTADGGYTLRVDHPSDLVQLGPEDDVVPRELRPKLMDPVCDQPLDWKTRGNAAFKDKDYRAAVDLYSRGLEALKKEEDGDEFVVSDIYRNRAQANIRLRRYEVALNDADAAVIPLDPLANDEADVRKANIKAFYRAGVAAYYLQDYTKAKGRFEAVLEISPIDADALRELRRTEKRIIERDTGDYDFEAMTEHTLQEDNRLDAATFRANVTVNKTADRGRGLFASRDIKTGELVLVEKALCVAFNTDEGCDQNVIINMNTEVMSVGTHTTRLVGVVHKLRYSPKLAEEFMRLYDGGYQPRGTKIVDGVVVVDTFQVEAALDFNGFGCPQAPTTQFTGEVDQATSSTGVWLTASFINHDCVGNASRSFIGDVMVIRATKDLKEGDEITMRYKNPEADITEFQKTLQSSWKFKCSCTACVAEAKTPDLKRQRRVQLIKEAASFIGANEITEVTPPSASLVSKAEQLRVKLEGSYDGTLFKDLPRHGLVELSLWICMAHIFGNQNKVQKAALAVLTDLGFKITATKKRMDIDRRHARMDMAGIHAAMYLAMSYYRQGQKKIGEQMEWFAREMYVIVHGCALGFEEKFGMMQG